MKNTRTSFIVAMAGAALLLPAGSAFSQKNQKEPPAAKGMPQKKEKGGKDGASQRAQFYAKLPDRLAEELDLTDEQKAKVGAAVEKSRGNLEAMQEKMRKEMFSMKEGIRENLTMDQKERFDMIIMKFMSHMMGGGMGPGGRGGMMGGGMGPGGRGGMMEGGMGRGGMMGGQDMDDRQGMMMRKRKMMRMKMMQEPGFEEEVEIEAGPEGGRMPPGGPDED